MFGNKKNHKKGSNLRGSTTRIELIFIQERFQGEAKQKKFWS